MRGWGDDTAYTWAPRTWYVFEMTFSGTIVSASITNKDDPTDMVEIPAWEIPDPQNRADGYAGVTASTRAGQIASIDNVVIKDAAGNVVFEDDFETFYGSSSTVDWELFK